MKYLKKQFLADVAKEAKSLKTMLTEEEKNKLRIEDLDPESEWHCVYGLISGYCNSKRATELIHSCCVRYFHTSGNQRFKQGMSYVKKSVNGTKIESVKTAEDLLEERGSSIRYFSSIEAYIITPNANRKTLVEYLKGERKDLAL